MMNRTLNEVFTKEISEARMVLFEFLTSNCRPWLPIYYFSFVDQYPIMIKKI